MLPRISLITPSFQQAGYLEECMASVQQQGYPSLEHIVVDGGSSDGSKAVIEHYAERLAWWCSEKDRGQSHAINKGLGHATGSIFGWLNSDDLLLPGALERVGQAFAADPQLLVLCGRRIIRASDGGQTISPLNDAATPVEWFTDPVVNQQATFYRMDVVKAAGGVDEALHYVMDLDLWWRILFMFGTTSVRFVPAELAVFRYHAESKTTMDSSAFSRETGAVLRGLVEGSQQQDLLEVLSVAYPAIPGLRPMPITEEHRSIIRHMVVSFVLKWNATIHTREEFEMMRIFRRTISLEGMLLDQDQRARLLRLDLQLRAANWLMFRMQRKIGSFKA